MYADIRLSFFPRATRVPYSRTVPYHTIMSSEEQKCVEKTRASVKIGNEFALFNACVDGFAAAVRVALEADWHYDYTSDTTTVKVDGVKNILLDIHHFGLHRRKAM